MPNKGDKYAKEYGNKETVTVLGVSADGWIKVRDKDGIHFVSSKTFDRYFKKIDEN